MIIGIDIDDVLYKTSEMMYVEGKKLLKTLGYTHDPDLSHYSLADAFKISGKDLSFVEKNLPWSSFQYLNLSAVLAIKKFVRQSDGAQVYIVTKRSAPDANPVCTYLADYLNLKIDKMICVPLNEKKSEYCDRYHIDVLLDDCSENILDIYENAEHCKGILVATPDVQHNIALAASYPNVLRDWATFRDAIIAITRGC